jgi:hypothetical protein
MNPTFTTRRVALALVTIVAFGLLALSSATPASPSSEPQQGGQIVSEVQAGRLNKTALSKTQYERVGQYLMGRALGSTQTYQAMDSLMDRVTGEAAAGAMYLYLGERYFGRNVQPDSRYAPFYGWMGSMMSSYRGSSPYARMMSGYLGSRSSGTTRSYPGPGMMGYGSPMSGSGASSGWPTAAIVAVVGLGTVLLVFALAVVFPRLRSRHIRPGRPATP